MAVIPLLTLGFKGVVLSLPSFLVLKCMLSTSKSDGCRVETRQKGDIFFSSPLIMKYTLER